MTNPTSGIFPSRFGGSPSPAAAPSATPAPAAVTPVAPPAAPSVTPSPPAPAAAAAPTGLPSTSASASTTAPSASSAPPTPARPPSGAGGRRPRTLEEVDRGLNHVFDRHRLLEDEWSRASVVLGELPTRMERIEAALGQFGARLDDTMRRLETLESFNVGQELQTLRDDVTELSRLQSSLLTAPPPGVGSPLGAGPTAAAALFPVIPQPRSSSSRWNAWMIGGVMIGAVVLLAVGTVFGPSILDRGNGPTGEGETAVSSSAKRLPSEDHGPSAAGEVLSGDSGDTEVIEDDIEPIEAGPRGEVTSQPSAHTEVAASSKVGSGAAVSATEPTPAPAASPPPAVKPTTVVAAPSATAAPASGASDVYVASSYPARSPKAHRTFKVKGPNLTVEVGEEILGGWSDGSMGIDFGQIASAGGSSFTLQNVPPGHYHWNVETLSGWRLETEGNQFRLNAAISINGQAVPVGTGKPHDHGDGANFCITVQP